LKKLRDERSGALSTDSITKFYKNKSQEKQSLKQGSNANFPTTDDGSGTVQVSTWTIDTTKPSAAIVGFFDEMQFDSD